MYQVEFYHKVGQHSGGLSFTQFNYCCGVAKEHRNYDLRHPGLTSAEYIGVAPNNKAKQFSIIYCTQFYLDYVSSLPNIPQEFLEACKKYVQTGQIQKGKYK